MEVPRMRMPDSLAALVDYGIIQEVVRPLMSGKEAQVYLVVSEGEERVAKVYKEAQARTFKHRAEYTEGRKTRNSRDQRAISKRTRHGRAQDEAAWRSTEVDMIHRLRDAGVRVPEPHQFIDGVLVMELVQDSAGDPAPRLGDLSFEPDQALEIYQALIAEVVRMLCAGVVHGDLSDFNVLMSADGPVMIDFPQSVDSASNQNARRLLLRDVDNLHRFLARFAPNARRPLYAQEMWELYQANRLSPTTKLAGGYRAPQQKTDTTDVLTLIGEAEEDERARREARGEDFALARPKPLRKVVDLSQEASRAGTPRGKRGAAGRGPAKEPGARKKASRNRRRIGSSESATDTLETSASAGIASAGEKDRRRRRRRPKRSGARRTGTPATSRSEGSTPQREAGESASSSKAGARAGRAERDNTVARPAKKRVRRRRRPAARRPTSSKG